MNPPINSAADLPALPVWAAAFIGKPFRLIFPKTGEGAGNLDLIIRKYMGKRKGFEIAGWAWDLQARAPIQRIVLVDADGIIVGVGQGGLERGDVPAQRSDVHSKNTGWKGLVGMVVGPLDAWGVLSQPQTVCRLGHIEL